MIRLIDTERGPRGVIRRYQHAQRGIIEVVSVWNEGSATIIHLQTYKISAPVAARAANFRRR